MPKLRYYAFDANGQKHARISERVYTHTVVYLPSYDRYLESAHSKEWDKSERANFDYYAAIAAGNDPHPRVNYMADHRQAVKWSAEEIAKGAERCAAENAKRRADAIERTAGHDKASFVAARLAERVATVEKMKAAGYFETWRNAGWCGRRQLAETLANKTRQHAAKVDILEPITND